MGFFWKNKKDSDDVEAVFRKLAQAQTPTTCNHLWKDFPWIIKAECSRSNTDEDVLTVLIEEPYVCARCKERKMVELERYVLRKASISKDEVENTIAALKKKYVGHWKEKAIVEDMIADFQLVDRQALAILEYLNGVTSTESGSLVLTKSNGEQITVSKEGTKSVSMAKKES